MSRIRNLVAGSLGALAVAAAHAQGFPEKPVHFIVPFAAGSATDQLARSLGQGVTEQTKQPVVVENKPGASGFLAAQHVAKAAPDGYTVIIATNTTHAANEHLFKKVPYDAVKDFAPITALGRGGQIMVVAPKVPAQSVADFIALAKKQPGKLTFGSGSSSSRVAGELFQQMAGVQLLRALGMSSRKRSPLAPDVPTIDEAGVKGYEMTFWFAAYAPAGTPPAIVNQLQALLVKATEGPAAKNFYQTSGIDPFVTTPAELAKFQVAESQKWGRIIKAAGIEPE